jgi:phosphatidylserine synthase
MLLSLAGAAVYVPLTAMLLRRARALYSGTTDATGTASAAIGHYVRAQRERLADFFRFKRRMDFIGVPVSCAIVVFVTFTLFVSGGVMAYPIASATMFAVWIGMSAGAVCAENRKRFAAPLRHLAGVLEDLERA